jgi:hypothetical protein
MEATFAVRHASIFETIADSDPEMLGRVEKLEAEDDALLKLIGEAHSQAKTLQTLGAAVGRDEERASKLQKAFTAAAESLVLRLKKQELAIEVWLTESQTRDRGVKD